jgi:hypothetical protein
MPIFYSTSSDGPSYSVDRGSMTPGHLAAILLRRAFHLVRTPGDLKSDVTKALNAVMPTPSAAQPQPSPDGWYGRVIGALEGARNAIELPTSGDIQRKTENAFPSLAQVLSYQQNGGSTPFGSLGGAPPPQSGAPMNITPPAAQGNGSLPGLLGNLLTKLQLQQQQPQSQPLDFAKP